MHKTPSPNNVRQATLDQVKAKSLHNIAHSLDTSSPPDPLAAEFMRYDADKLEQAAIDTLTLTDTPPIGTGGELVPQADQIKRGGGNFIDTVEYPDAATAEASMDRLKLADDGIQCVALAVDTADTIQAENSVEKMMAHQMAAAHKLAMTFAGKARELIEHDAGGNGHKAVYAAEAARVANSSAKMMDAYQKGVLALHKLRTGGKQVVTVQHVNVSDGGQAVVTGGINSGGNDEK